MKQKPVWRVNSGNGVPSDAKPFGEAMFRGGSYEELDCEPDEYYWHIDGFPSDITAYQTTRTKAAKYERVECELCEGEGHYWVDYCNKCNGHGHTWRRI